MLITDGGKNRKTPNHQKMNDPFSVRLFLTHFFPFCATALGPKLTEKRLDRFIGALKIHRSLCAKFGMEPLRFHERRFSIRF